MKKINDGGPAFPVIGGHSQSFGPFGETDNLTIGMSLRDYFAAKAMQGFCVEVQMWPSDKFKIWAEKAYECADAMLAAREAGK